MLCELAHSFPPFVAQLLERDAGLTRNFREETVTDLLMASLVGLSAYGISVHFPDEPTTGGDMEWNFVAPDEPNGGRYLRLLIQAKRAKFESNSGGYWYYDHLDHGSPKGTQAQTLMSYSAKPPDGKPAFPLYMFYHPKSAVDADKKRPQLVEGINLIPASRVAPVVWNGCSRGKKRVSKWRDQFLPLSDFLCWPIFPSSVSTSPSDGQADVSEDGIGPNPDRTVGFHPDLVARRLQNRLERMPNPQAMQDQLAPESFVADEIPTNIQRAIAGKVTREDRKTLKRPRVIFTTRVKRGQPEYVGFEEFLKSQLP